MYALMSICRTNRSVERNGGLDTVEPAAGMGESRRRGAGAA